MRRSFALAATLAASTLLAACASEPLPGEEGYDEYAAVMNFEAKAPQQAFWITTPERGITMSMPIACEHPKEGWR